MCPGIRILWKDLFDVSRNKDLFDVSWSKDPMEGSV